jgi:two-component system, sensor histidine kinase PdtaS
MCWINNRSVVIILSMIQPGRVIIKLITLTAVAISFFCHIDANAQSRTSNNPFGYNLALQRLQFMLTTDAIQGQLQGQVDIDSTAHLVSEGEHLPFELFYNEAFDDGADGEIKDLLKNGAFWLFKTGSIKSDLDKSFAFLTKAKTIADKQNDLYYQLASLTLLGKYYLQVIDSAKSDYYFSEVVRLSRKSENSKQLLLALANQGTYAGYNKPQKESLLNEALQLALQQGNKTKEIEMRTRIYEIYFYSRYMLDTVKKQLAEVTELEKSIGFQHLQYNYLFFAYLDDWTSDFKGMFSDATKAVKTMESTGDLAFSNFIYGNVAFAYSFYGDTEKALQWYKKCIQQDANNLAKRSWYYEFVNTVYLLAHSKPKEMLDLINETIRQYPPQFVLHKQQVYHITGYCYQILNQPDSAELYYRKAQKYIDSTLLVLNPSDHFFDNYFDFCYFYIKRGQTDLAKKYFKKLNEASSMNSQFEMEKILFIQYELDSSAGNYKAAMYTYYRYREIDDSLFNIKQAKQESEIQIQYETELKDKNIALLTQQDKVQQISLRQTNIVKNFTLAGIGLMLLISGLLYNRYRTKQKTNTEIQVKNQELEQLVRDKDWLVQEIHHRVKNNLHTIVSLLESQSMNLQNDAFDALQDSRNRIYAMSLIHQKLYQTDFDSSINMAAFLPELVENLRLSFNVGKRIIFVENIDPIVLDVSQATPVGLILNEAIINAIKYAFPADRQDNMIVIHIGNSENNQIEFHVSDNGIGLPEDFELRAENGLGIKLMRGLTEELHGKFCLSRESGTKISIRFSPKESIRKTV